MRIRSVGAGLVVAAAVTAFSPGSAMAETFSYSTPFSQLTDNPCTGETVLVEGTAHFTNTFNATESGGHTHVAMNLSGVTGTTATGVRYTMNQNMSDTSHFDFDPTGGSVGQFQNRTRLIRQGETTGILGALSDDFSITERAHLTINDNGIPTAVRPLEVETECR